ncbi:MAG: branched-chain amino acid aminotransferase [Albidovulum sp.]|nr:branched-chain amino acid aminotransferase [Albidovulum sp.]
MVIGTDVKTYFDGRWHDDDVMVMRAADHGSWLGSSVFDGARFFEGVAPDLLAHCRRLNDSATSMGITPVHTEEDLLEISLEGLKRFSESAAVYIRPMYWALDGGKLGVLPKENATGFCVCLEELPMPPANKPLTLTRTRFRRPVLADAVVNAKAGCLYPNNGRMLREANDKGFDNALVADALGNVAETAVSNIFMTRDKEIFTPAANGTFLAGITRARVIKLLRNEGFQVHETVLTFEDFDGAEEVFTTGNMSKISPVSQFDDTNYQLGRIARLCRELYWDWAKSEH